MWSFTVASLLALCATATAGWPLHPVDTISGVVQGISHKFNNSSATGYQHPRNTVIPSFFRAPRASLQDVPRMGRLKVADTYYMAMGQHYPRDYRGKVSQFVAGITYTGSGLKFNFERRTSQNGPDTYMLRVIYSPLTPRPWRWYLGAHRYYPKDSFDDKDHSLRVITHSDPRKAGLWRFVENPSDSNTMLMVLHEDLDWTARDVRGWYLAVSDSPSAERDCISTYLTVTDDQAKAATVEFA